MIKTVSIFCLLTVFPYLIFAQPQKVEAEDFLDHQGIKLEQTSDKGGGNSLAFISNGDFAKYSIQIDQPGHYKFQFRVATKNRDSGSIEVVLGDKTLGELTVPNTNGWQEWESISKIFHITPTGKQALTLNFKGGEGSLFNVNWFSYGLPAPIDLTIGNRPQQKMRYGLDFERLWYWPKSKKDQELLAKWSVTDCDIDYIRVAINCAYELEEGKYDPKAYSRKILPMMRAMKAADPELKYFASPRPLDEAINKAAWQPYPRWITGNRGNRFDFNPEKCGEYLVRYLELMKSNGFKIDFLDLTNEWQSLNSFDKFTIGDAVKIRTHLKENLPQKDLPLLIAPSSWSYQEGSFWMKRINTEEKRKAIDIAASHNTNKTGSAEQFAKASRKYLGKNVEIWNTELHGWKSVKGADEVLTSSYLFEAIEAGFSGINGWLAVGTKNQGHSYYLNERGKIQRNVKYYIFKKLTNTSNYGHALPVQQDKFKCATALLKNNSLTVWVVNDSPNEQIVDIKGLDLRFSDSEIRSTRWSKVENLPVEGVAKKLSTTDPTSLKTIIKSQSLYCFEITLES